MGAKIEAIEYYFPKRKLTNLELSTAFPNYDFGKFETKIGIKNRYLVSENETGLDLAIEASKKLFQRIDKNEIDFILYCTQSPDYILPTTACIFQDRMGLRKDIGALDFNLGCSGYTYGISMAKGLINSKQAKNVLLITAETYSKLLNPLDRSNRSLFGDAATVTLICESEEDMIGNFRFGTDGSGYNQLIVKNGASRHRYNSEADLINYGSENAYTENDLYMDGPGIFNFTSEKIPPFVEGVLKANTLEKVCIDQFIFHQANAFMLNVMRKKLNIEKSKFFIDLADGGNTVSCTVPIALKNYSLLKDFTHNEKIILVGFGVGLSWSGGLVKINHKL